MVSFSTFHPWPTGAGMFGTDWWACIHILASQDAPRRCCSKLASEGGSFESVVSIVVANLKRW